MIRLVLDTNVLVSANLVEGGLEAAVVALGLNGKVQIFVSDAILDEYRRVLLYPPLKFDAKEVGRFLDRFSTSSILVAPTRILSLSSDEPDNRFLECSEAAVADFLVTGNKRHFPKRWKSTKIVDARELLGQIGSSFLK